MTPTLAPETIDTIIDHLHSDRTSLFACSLTAKQWLPTTRFHIFAKVHIRPANIESFLSLLREPNSQLPFMMRHLLVNGFNTFIIANGYPGALDHLNQVASLLREVKYLRLLNSSEATHDIVSQMPKIVDLEVHTIHFTTMNHFLDLVYAFPHLEALSFAKCTVTDSNLVPREALPGTGTSFIIRNLNARVDMYYPLGHWLMALRPVPHIRSIHFVEDRKNPLKNNVILQLIGSLIMGLTLDVRSLRDEDIIIDSRRFVGLKACTNLKTLHLDNITGPNPYEDPEDLVLGHHRWVRKLLSDLSSDSLTELRLSLTNTCLFGLSTTEEDSPETLEAERELRFDWDGLVEYLIQPNFAKLQRIQVDTETADPHRCQREEMVLRAGPLSIFDSRGMLTFTHKTGYLT